MWTYSLEKKKTIENLGHVLSRVGPSLEGWQVIDSLGTMYEGAKVQDDVKVI